MNKTYKTDQFCIRSMWQNAMYDLHSLNVAEHKCGKMQCI